MKSDKLIEAVIKGSAVINSVRKINKSLNVFRVIAYVLLVTVIILNAAKIAEVLKSNVKY